MPVASVETLLALEVMSCRMEPCGTMAVEVPEVVEAATEAGKGAWTETTGNKQKEFRSVRRRTLHGAVNVNIFSIF